jgi:hypothetical protein
MSHAQKIVIQELQELRFFELDARNNFVEDFISLTLWIFGNNLNCLLKHFEWNGNLNQILNHLEDNNLYSRAAEDQKI